MDKLHGLYNLLAVIRETNKAIRYGDILRLGYSRHMLDEILADTRAILVQDEEGYTLITFKVIQKG